MVTCVRGSYEGAEGESQTGNKDFYPFVRGPWGGRGEEGMLPQAARKRPFFGIGKHSFVGMVTVLSIFLLFLPWTHPRARSLASRFGAVLGERRGVQALGWYGDHHPVLLASSGEGGGNQCDACPKFVTFGIVNGGKRTLSGLKGMAAAMNSTAIFVHTIAIASHSLANAHKGCWKFYVYSDDEEILKGKHGINLLGKEVVIRRAPNFPRNIYDSMKKNLSETVEPSQDPILNATEAGGTYATRLRGYQSVSRCKLDLVKAHLDLGEKVIWMDMDTQIVTDMSCIYKELDHFVIAPGFKNWNTFKPLINHWSAPWHVPKGKEPLEWLQSMPGKHFVFGDLWMANIELIQAALDVETWLAREWNARAQLDIQTYFSILHYRNWTGLNDLARMERWKNYSWGFQHVDFMDIPYAKTSHHFHVGYANGTLLATTTCKKIGAMSWNWPSFQRMSYSPCIFFADDNVTEYLGLVYRWGASTVRGWKSAVEGGCTGFRRRSVRPGNCGGGIRLVDPTTLSGNKTLSNKTLSANQTLSASDIIDGFANTPHPTNASSPASAVYSPPPPVTKEEGAPRRQRKKEPRGVGDKLQAAISQGPSAFDPTASPANAMLKDSPPAVNLPPPPAAAITKDESASALLGHTIKAPR